MRKYINIKTLFVLVLLVTGVACETDFDNPNAPTDEQTYSSREGILAASVGMQQLYSTTGLRWIIETPAITTREAAITTTFQNMIELEDGGALGNAFDDIRCHGSNFCGTWIGVERGIIVQAQKMLGRDKTGDARDWTVRLLGSLFKANDCLVGLHLWLSSNREPACHGRHFGFRMLPSVILPEHPSPSSV